VRGQGTGSDVSRGLSAAHRFATASAWQAGASAVGAGVRTIHASDDANHGPPITNRDPEIAAFLIDTLPIRIALTSFVCLIGARSNRHSSAPLSLNYFEALAPELCNRMQGSAAQESGTPRERHKQGARRKGGRYEFRSESKSKSRGKSAGKSACVTEATANAKAMRPPSRFRRTGTQKARKGGRYELNCKFEGNSLPLGRAAFPGMAYNVGSG
jgi:hypothetical protein